MNQSLLSKGYPTRSFVVINTKQDGSNLLTVYLYQYNSDVANSVESDSVLLDEKNIHPDPESSRKTYPLIP